MEGDKHSVPMWWCRRGWSREGSDKQNEFISKNIYKREGFHSFVSQENRDERTGRDGSKYNFFCLVEESSWHDCLTVLSISGQRRGKSSK
jgi:hypothetical protein